MAGGRAQPSFGVPCRQMSAGKPALELVEADHVADDHVAGSVIPAGCGLTRKCAGFEQDEFVLSDDADDQTYHAQLDAIPPLEDLIRKYQPAIAPAEKHFLKEFVLWGLVESKKLSKSQIGTGTSFSDQFSNYVRGGMNG